MIEPPSDADLPDEAFVPRYPLPVRGEQHTSPKKPGPLVWATVAAGQDRLRIRVTARKPLVYLLAVGVPAGFMLGALVGVMVVVAGLVSTQLGVGIGLSVTLCAIVGFRLRVTAELRRTGRCTLVEADLSAREIRLPMTGQMLPVARVRCLELIQRQVADEFVGWRSQLRVVYIGDDDRWRREAVVTSGVVLLGRSQVRRLERALSRRVVCRTLTDDGEPVPFRGTNPEEIVWPMPAVEDVPLAYCPKCSYALFDLPGAKVCPECGAER
ncbi:MAG: zinc ribbon domain-containing protein [Phycisphaeraceae bacterium]|nr:zinc ribbon domain-containing protein [Phycisphaeraceae bacterium]